VCVAADDLQTDSGLDAADEIPPLASRDVAISPRRDCSMCMCAPGQMTAQDGASRFWQARESVSLLGRPWVY